MPDADVLGTRADGEPCPEVAVHRCYEADDLDGPR
jgi:hypothetical protein